MRAHTCATGQTTQMPMNRQGILQLPAVRPKRTVPATLALGGHGVVPVRLRQRAVRRPPRPRHKRTTGDSHDKGPDKQGKKQDYLAASSGETYSSTCRTTSTCCRAAAATIQYRGPHSCWEKNKQRRVKNSFVSETKTRLPLKPLDIFWGLGGGGVGTDGGVENKKRGGRTLW